MSRGFAENLELAIKRYAKPIWRPPMSVFRDEKYLRPGTNLPDLIRRALASSEYFIYLASPEAARSQWVQDELGYWCADRERLKRLIIVLTSGRVVFEPRSKRIRWRETTALPRSLSDQLKIVPYYIDLSWAKQPAQQSLLDPDYRRAINTIVATLRDIHPAELSDIAIKEHRKGIIVRNLFVSAICGLAITLGIAAALAWSSARQADSRRLAALALAETADHRVDTALLLAQQAVKIAPTYEAQSALLSSISGFPHLKRFLHGHRDPVNMLAFSHRGRYLASGGTQGSVFLWKLAEKQGEALPINHTDWVTALAFDSSETILASGSADGTIHLWDVAQGRPWARVPEITHRGGLMALGFATSGRQLFSVALDRKIRFWDLASGNQVKEIELGGVRGPELNAVFSRDGNLLAGGAGETICIWDTQSGKERQILKSPPRGPLLRLDFSADAKRLAAGSHNGEIKIWNMATGEEESLMPLQAHTFSAAGLAFSPEGQALFSGGGDNLLKKWTLDGRPRDRPELSLQGHRSINAVAVSPDGRMLATGDYTQEGGAAHAIALWDLEGSAFGRRLTGASVQTLPFERTPLAVSSDGQWIAWGSSNGTLRIWDTSLDREAQVFPGHRPILALSFDSEKGVLASADDRGVIRFWDVAAGDELRNLTFRGPHSGTTSLLFSRDGETLITTGSDNRIQFWSLEMGYEIFPPIQAQGGVTFSDNARFAACIGPDKAVHVWNLRNRQEQVVLLPKDSSPQDLALSPDGRVIAMVAGFGGDIVLWDVSAKAQLPTLSSMYQAGAGALAYSPDGGTFASTGADGVVLWDIKEEYGKLALLKIVSKYGFGKLVFSANGKLVAFRNPELIGYWKLDQKAWIQTAKDMANRYFYLSEWNRFFRDDLFTRKAPPSDSRP